MFDSSVIRIVCAGSVCARSLRAHRAPVDALSPERDRLGLTLVPGRAVSLVMFAMRVLAALDNSLDGDLVASVPVPDSPPLAADVRLVRLDDPGEHLGLSVMVARIRWERCHAVRYWTPSMRESCSD